MRQDADEVLARTRSSRDLAVHATDSHLVLIAIVACGALFLVAIGVEVAAVKDVLTIIFPPIIALAANAAARARRRKTPARDERRMKRSSAKHAAEQR